MGGIIADLLNNQNENTEESNVLTESNNKEVKETEYYEVLDFNE